jgi:cytidylate kinase
LYRGVALEVKRAGIDPADERALALLCRKLCLAFRTTGDGQRLYSGGNDITDLIRTPDITMLASMVSAKEVVRKGLLALQRKMGLSKQSVFEGRDMGTVVFPEADVKFFLDADLKVRAKRRYLELVGKSDQSLEDVTRDMRQRDQNDSTRTAAPLKMAVDAIRIDTTSMTIEDVLDHMLGHIFRHAEKT